MDQNAGGQRVKRRTTALFSGVRTWFLSHSQARRFRYQRVRVVAIKCTREPDVLLDVVFQYVLSFGTPAGEARSQLTSLIEGPIFMRSLNQELQADLQLLPRSVRLLQPLDESADDGGATDSGKQLCRAGLVERLATAGARGLLTTKKGVASSAAFAPKFSPRLGNSLLTRY